MPCPAKELGGIAPFVAMFGAISERQRQNVVASDLLDGAGTRVARSGTACRAPTVGNGKSRERRLRFLDFGIPGL